jgi:glycosyltransferase involved in cell wall biosynthesis
MSMKIAYLINQYPHVRHTFIRREVVGVEQHGLSVERFSIRASTDKLVDPADQAEFERTHVLLKEGAAGLAWALLAAALRSPLRWLRAARMALRMGWRSQRGLLRHGAYFAEACLLHRRLEACGAQHLHAHFGTNPAVVVLLAHLLGGPSYSLTIHGSEEWDRPESLSLREKYENAAFVVSVSEYGRCQVFRWCGHTHWHKVHVVRCGVDEVFLGEGPRPVPDTLRLVSVGALVEQKGQLRLLEALAQLRAEGQGFDMVLVGDGPLRAVLEAEIRKLDLEGRVRITGWLSNADVKQQMLEARALVMPSFAENLPVVIMESLALGRPVVCTQLAGIPELIENEVNGWMVPPGSVDLLAAALKSVLQTPVDRLSEMGRAGAARVAERHDAAREAAKMAELFKQVANRSAADA